MEMGTSTGSVPGRRGVLYPMLVSAAIAVIIFSALGAAVMTGLLPRAESKGEQQQFGVPPPPPQATAPPRSQVLPMGATPGGAECADCGVVEAINAVEVNGQGSGLGAVAGGITGALLGSQIGRGGGRTVATIAGGAGGAFAGNEIEKNMKKAVRYQVRLRMSNGTQRTAYQTQPPAFGVGQKVRLVDGRVVAAS